VVVGKSTTSEHVALLKAADPYYAFSRAVVMLYGYRKHPHDGVSPKANVDPTATIGAGTVVYPGVFIGPRARVGADCIIYPNAVIYDDCVIGDRVIIHANATIGNDGYGFATHKGAHHKIPQVGNVVLGDDCGNRLQRHRRPRGAGQHAHWRWNENRAAGYDRAQLCRSASMRLIVAQAGIAGSVTVGHHVTMAGQVGVAGHISIGSHVTIGAQSGVISNIPDHSTLLGSPAMPIRQTRRVTAVYVQLPELLNRVRQLEQQVEELGTPDEQSNGK